MLTLIVRARPRAVSIFYGVKMSNCIISPLPQQRSGYANEYRNGLVKGAHVWAWIDAHGGTFPPKGLHICHKCDVRNCINPDHLFLGTPQQNQLDKIRKGRHRYAPKSLSNDQVLLIRKIYGGGKVSMAELSDYFNVSETAIFLIIHRVTYKNI